MESDDLVPENFIQLLLAHGFEFLKAGAPLYLRPEWQYAIHPEIRNPAGQPVAVVVPENVEGINGDVMAGGLAVLAAMLGVPEVEVGLMVRESSAVIGTFRGDYAFLSNFHPAQVMHDSRPYPTVEHAFQAAKTFSEHERRDVRLAATPAKAKQMGRKVTRRADWGQVKVGIMYDLVWQKFSGDEDLGARLLATGRVPLIEGNRWNDSFWGIPYGKRGRNHLGRILMAVRRRLRLGDGEGE